MVSCRYFCIGRPCVQELFATEYVSERVIFCKMNLYEFLELDKYPIRDRVQYKEAFEAFLQSTQLKPFFDAMMRNASSAAMVELKSKILAQAKQIWVIFDSFLPEDKRREIETWSHIWDELTIGPSRLGPRVYTFRVSDSVLREGLFFAASKEIAAIELEVRRVGRIALENEHRAAMSSLERSDQVYYAFDEYLAAAWKEVADDSGAHQVPGLYQRLGYLAYLENLVSRFNQPGLLYTENTKQAKALCEEIAKQRALVAAVIASLDALSAKLSEAKIERVRKSLGKDDLVMTHPDAAMLQKEINTLRSRESNMAAAIKKYEDYWRDNFPKFLGRACDIQTMVSLPFGALRVDDIFFRNVTEGEYKSLQELKQFSQAPGCLEREKWFYTASANPGVGVSHPICCKIYLHQGALALLGGLQKKDGCFAAVAKKEAEPGCFGIHEDALPAFNAMIVKVEFFGRGNRRLGEIVFDRPTSLKALVAIAPDKSAVAVAVAQQPAFLFLGGMARANVAMERHL